MQRITTEDIEKVLVEAANQSVDMVRLKLLLEFSYRLSDDQITDLQDAFYRAVEEFTEEHLKKSMGLNV